MEYEKKYKEALANARQEYNTTENVERKQWLEELFPELAESEDERIRNALIALLKFGLEDGSAIAPGFNETKEQALAWLEKQGEQKSTAWSEWDEVRLNRIVANLELLNVADGDILLEDIDWLKSLKDRVQGKEEKK